MGVVIVKALKHYDATCFAEEEGPRRELGLQLYARYFYALRFIRPLLCPLSSALRLPRFARLGRSRWLAQSPARSWGAFVLFVRFIRSFYSVVLFGRFIRWFAYPFAHSFARSLAGALARSLVRSVGWHGRSRVRSLVSFVGSHALPS